MDSHVPPELDVLVARAYSRMQRRLAVGAPTLATHVAAWTRSLSGGAAPVAYFTHPRAFPMLLLPWWLEGALGVPPAKRFMGDVVYSTLNGYYFVRMIDDLMDRDRLPSADVIPALISFHTEFQRTYQKHFPYDHGFWSELVAASLMSAEMASRDAATTVVTRDRFVEITARKIVGARVPVAAVCHYHARLEPLAEWYALVEALGRWHQMLNDIFGWASDLKHDRSTYFLSEGRARVGDGGSVAEWVISGGLEWGAEQLEGWMAELVAHAEGLGSDSLVSYLRERQRDADEGWRALSSGLHDLRKLAASVR